MCQLPPLIIPEWSPEFRVSRVPVKDAFLYSELFNSFYKTVARLQDLRARLVSRRAPAGAWPAAALLTPTDPMTQQRYHGNEFSLPLAMGH